MLQAADGFFWQNPPDYLLHSSSERPVSTQQCLLVSRFGVPFIAFVSTSRYARARVSTSQGLQCETPLTRAMKPLGGVRLLKRAVEEKGCELPPKIEKVFKEWRRTHNDVVFGLYTPEMRAARKNHIITVSVTISHARTAQCRYLRGASNRSRFIMKKTKLYEDEY